MKVHFITKLLIMVIYGLLIQSCVETLPEGRPALLGEPQTVQDPTEDPTADPDGDGVSTEFKRPDGQIVFKADLCSCSDGKATMVGLCDSFCSTKTQSTEYLYANFQMGVLELDQNFSTLNKWCNIKVEGDPSIDTAQCVLEIQSEDSPKTEVIISKDSDFFDGNSIRVGVGGQFEDGVTYILTLVEQSSGARTTSVNYTRTQDPPDENTLGPLQILPVNQYTCMTRGFTGSNVGDTFYETAYRLHFYFTGAQEPPAVPPGVRTIFCHDIYATNQTLDDNIQYPRMELQPGHYNTWNYNDSRFATDQQTNNLKIHDMIKTQVEQNGGSYANGQKIFYPFSWPSFPKQALPGDLQSPTMPDQSLMGYIMTPWIDNNTFKVYCPNQSHYYSNNQLFIAVRELVGVDTEGLYLSIRETLTTTNDAGNTVLATDDYLLIREGQLKRIWFYFQNGQHIRADQNTAATKTVHFYWPPDPENPFIKKSNQKLFTVRHPSDFTNPATSQADIVGQSGQIKGDKKFGCIPAIAENKFSSNFVSQGGSSEASGEDEEDDDDF